ncbi:MAG TPA: serine hydrolase, partial [Kofleriaceae bacterium]|nr:serine hydrolase [Kofleriaceae bacterium]
MRTSARLRSSLLIAALAAATTTAAACGRGSATGPSTATPMPTPGPAPAPTPAPVPPIVDGPTAEESLAWVLDTINGGGKLTTADVESRFAPSFLKVVPADKVVTIFGQLAGQLPPIKQLKLDSKPPLELSALLDTAAGGVRVGLQMTATTPRQIAGLVFAPATSEAPPRTYGDAVAQLEKAATKTELFVAEIDKGTCKPLQNHNSTDRLGIGSAFKLWVLLALDDKLAHDKKLTWDTMLAVRDEAKSLPSGEMQDLPAGTQRSLRDFATNMISISDNTATDHLIDFVGREQVEKALTTAKHGDPKLDIPFLRTREMFALKLAVTPAELDAYRKAPVAAKKKLLESYRQRPIDVAQAVKDWTAPRDLDLEWFASGPDLCNVMATLGDRANWKPEAEPLSILAKNPGAPYDKSKWTYIGFKGGSEPGVMNLTWLGHRVDDRWFVVTATVNDDQKAIDEALVVNAAAGALAILGGEAPAAAPAP